VPPLPRASLHTSSQLGTGPSAGVSGVCPCRALATTIPHLQRAPAVSAGCQRAQKGLFRSKTWSLLVTCWLDVLLACFWQYSWPRQCSLSAPGGPGPLGPGVPLTCCVETALAGARGVLERAAAEAPSGKARGAAAARLPRRPGASPHRWDVRSRLEAAADSSRVGGNLRRGRRELGWPQRRLPTRQRSLQPLGAQRAVPSARSSPRFARRRTRQPAPLHGPLRALGWGSPRQVPLSRGGLAARSGS